MAVQPLFPEPPKMLANRNMGFAIDSVSIAVKSTVSRKPNLRNASRFLTWVTMCADVVWLMA
jgi:hypothetical protein